jgi:TonB-linked SusC/RagA family outer membrane protein
MKYPFFRDYAIILLILFSPLFLLAQNTVSGRVMSIADNAPVGAATIMIKGTKTGTSTDADGYFSLNAKTGDVLLISGIGMVQQTFPVGTQTKDIVIFVKPGTSDLNEVVVTALGIRKETKRLGYSVQTVNGDDLLKARESNPVNGLVGKVSGLTVGINQELLASPTVLLRGSPLNFYIVDGIPINSDTWNISPDDIETYTVLKGATAAALYGNRGINGAILITTKRGAKSKKGYTVEFNSSTQFNSGFIAVPKVQNQYGGGDNQQYAFGDYLSNGTGSGRNDKDYDVWGPLLDGRLLPQYDGPYDATKNYTTSFGPNLSTFTGNIQPTPWTARGTNNLQNFLQTGLLTVNNLNFSSVTDRSSIRVSITDQYQKGITPNTSLNLVNMNILGTYNVSDKFLIEANISYNRQFTPNIPDVAYGPNSIIYDVDIWTGADWNVKDPNIVNYWQPGKTNVQSNFVEYKRYQNPYFMSYAWLRGHYKNDMYSWAAFTYKFNPDLNLMLRSNITTYDVLRTEKQPFSAHPYGDEQGLGNYREDRRDLWENNTELLLRYNKENIKNTGITLGVFIGGQARNMKYSSSYTSTNYLIVPAVYTFSNSKLPVNAYSYGSSLLTLSAYYSVDVTYKQYFTISTTGRLDKSSAFPTNNNSYFYPSVSFATPVSDYIEMPTAITFLKLRASYANVKNGATNAFIGNAYQSLGINGPVGYGSNYYTPFDGPNYQLASPPYSTYPVYANITGADAPNYSVDPGIKPNSRSNFEFGLDMRFVHNRLGLSATYFQYKDGPVITNQYVSETSGINYFVTNGQTTKRTGGEVSLTGTPIQATNSFRWDILINWATYTEVYSAFAGGATEIGNGTGYPDKIGGRVDKLFGNYEALTPEGKVIHDESGFPIYLPKYQYLGHSDPDWSWGINNKFSYKSWSFSFQFDGMVGGLIQDRVLRKLTEGGRGENTVTGVIGQARLYESQHMGDIGYFGADPNNPTHNAGARDANGKPILGGDGVQVVGGSGNISYDDQTGVINNYKDLQFVQNDSTTIWMQDYVNSFYNDPQHTTVSKTYAKLREVVITYSLPAKLLQGTFISRVQISLVGRNLLYFFPSAFHDIDVDQYPGRNQFNQKDLEYNLQTPTTRSYGFNVNVTF